MTQDQKIIRTKVGLLKPAMRCKSTLLPSTVKPQAASTGSRFCPGRRRSPSFETTVRESRSRPASSRNASSMSRYRKTARDAFDGTSQLRQKLRLPRTRIARSGM